MDDNALRNRERGITEQFALLRQSVVRWRETKGRLIDDWLKRDGVLRAKAFPGRAAILVKLLGLDGEAVSAVYEKPGSLKIGHYLPGTRIPIESDETLFSLPDQALPILNLAWHIPDEIRRYLASNGYSGPVIDIVNAEDFEPPPQ